ncbi:MAG: hypothetical protein EOP34_08220 [Rickettsiales bacterium]|nr:MAG: hypothetical protein EOP34_08220 [Rickettsiales bacterium]
MFYIKTYNIIHLYMVKNKWIPKLGTKFKNIDTHSWFDICETFRNKYSKRIKTDIHNDTTLIRSRANRLYPSEEQSEILRKWFNLTRKIYNATTRFIRKNIYTDNKIDKKKVAEFVNFRKLRTNYLKNIKNDLSIDRINSHILDQAIQRCVSMYKSCLTKYKKNNIFEFRIRTIKRTKRYHSFDIEKILFSKVKNGFCTNVLGELKSDKSIIAPEKGCVLVYDRYLSKYVLHMPYEVNVKSMEINDLNCGIDPGIRTFLTVYSRDDVLEIGKNINYEKYFSKIDSLNKSMKYKKAIGKVYDKINNKTKDMHFKVGKLLCSKVIFTRSVNMNLRNILRTFLMNIRVANIIKKSQNVKDILFFVKNKIFVVISFQRKEIIQNKKIKLGKISILFITSRKRLVINNLGGVYSTVPLD